MKTYLIKFANETIEEAVSSGIFFKRSEAEAEARYLIVQGYAEAPYEIIEMQDGDPEE